MIDADFSELWKYVKAFKRTGYWYREIALYAEKDVVAWVVSCDSRISTVVKQLPYVALAHVYRTDITVIPLLLFTHSRFATKEQTI